MHTENMSGNISILYLDWKMHIIILYLDCHDPSQHLTILLSLFYVTF